MMMRMLEAGGIAPLVDHLRKADEDNPRGYYEFEPVKQTRKDPSWLAEAGGRVVKMVHLLLYDLPLDRPFRVVFMRRNLEEVVRSQNVMLERKGKASSDLGEDRIMGLFRQQVREIIDYLAKHPNFKVLEVDYNEMLTNPAPAITALNSFLGGRLNTSAMAEVIDPTLYRQRRKS